VLLFLHVLSPFVHLRRVACVRQLQLAKEKVDLENRLTAEQEYIMNKLQAQLEMLAREKLNLQKVGCPAAPDTSVLQPGHPGLGNVCGRSLTPDQHSGPEVAMCCPPPCWPNRTSAHSP
jgi:hypothetical protein